MQMVYADWGFEALRKEAELEAIYRQEAFEYPEVADPIPTEDELVATAPDGAVGMCPLQDEQCGICELVVPARSVAYLDILEDGGVTHMDCWLGELADAANPYSYYGVSQRDF